ncbi:MAG: hypothetical protein ACMXX9_01710 [Candidatus Woesearchaeota archaeon]
MKHSVIKGILHDFSNHIGLLIWHNKLKLKEYKKTNALEQKDEFEKYCVAFLFERLPQEFEINRITKYVIEIIKKKNSVVINFELNLDKQKIQYETVYTHKK